MLTDNLETILLIGAVFLLVTVSALFLHLSGDKRKREQFNKQANRRFDSLSSDIQGLSVAAVNIDERMLEYELRIKSLLERIDALEKYEKTSQPYFNAIEEIRNGVGAEELASRCNLTLDEAKLLVKLHRN